MGVNPHALEDAWSFLAAEGTKQGAKPFQLMMMRNAYYAGAYQCLTILNDCHTDEPMTEERANEIVSSLLAECEIVRDRALRGEFT